jgi:hypothetical protein
VLLLNDMIWRSPATRRPTSLNRIITCLVEVIGRLVRLTIRLTEGSMEDAFGRCFPFPEFGVVAAKRLYPLDIINLLRQQFDCFARWNGHGNTVRLCSRGHGRSIVTLCDDYPGPCPSSALARRDPRALSKTDPGGILYL